MVDMTPGMFSEAVTNLTERVEELTAKVEGGVEGGPPSSNLEGRLRAVEQVLGEVRKAVSGLAQKKAAADAQTQLRRPWHMLTAEQAEKRWLDLRGWVEFLVERNNIGSKEIPDCWYLHGGLVDELEALRWAWLETNKPDSKLTEPIWWREALHRARTRWASFNPNGCTSSHSETRSRKLPGDKAWSDFLAEELADRPADRPAAARAS
jgi:hypothetical protein